MTSWLNDRDGFYKNINEKRDTGRPDWQFFADALHAASLYE